MCFTRLGFCLSLCSHIFELFYSIRRYKGTTEWVSVYIYIFKRIHNLSWCKINAVHYSKLLPMGVSGSCPLWLLAFCKCLPIVPTCAFCNCSYPLMPFTLACTLHASPYLLISSFYFLCQYLDPPAHYYQYLYQFFISLVFCQPSWNKVMVNLSYRIRWGFTQCS